MPSCETVAAAMARRQRVGELFMVAVEATASPAEGARAARAAGVGSVVLLGTSRAGIASVAALTSGIRAAVPGVLVATDQEGGTVQRLQGEGFETIPSAARQASLSDADLRAAASRWGGQLAAAGVRYDLAPVADVVPAGKVGSNAPIGQLNRGYGSDPAAVGAKAAAFVSGMRAAGVATSLKHFPTLGEVTGNTDYTPATDTVTTRTSPAVRAFVPGIVAGAQSVMVSSAVYTRIDPGVPAVFSRVVVTEMLRGDLGFTGVVISDDLGVAASVASVAPADRALRFFAAGGDLLINADPAKQAARRPAWSSGPLPTLPSPLGSPRARHACCVSRPGSVSPPAPEGQAPTLRAAMASRAGWTYSGEVSGIDA